VSHSHPPNNNTTTQLQQQQQQQQQQSNNCVNNNAIIIIIIINQVEGGLYAIKRLGFFLKKMASSRKACGVEISKNTAHEAGKKARIEEDAMRQHVAAYNQIMSTFQNMASAQEKFANELESTIIKPLDKWHAAAEAKQKKLWKQETALKAKYKALEDSVKKERTSCLKEWRSFQDAEKSFIKASDNKVNSPGNKSVLKKFASAQKARTKQAATTSKSFAKLEQLIVHANDEHKHYWHSELSKLISDFEMLEVDRMYSMQMFLVQFAKLQRELITPLDAITKSVDETVYAIDSKKQVRDFVDAQVMTNGKPKAPPRFFLGLPCTSSDVDKNDVELCKILKEDATTVVQRRESKLAMAQHNSENKYAAEEESDEEPEEEQKAAQQQQQQQRQSVAAPPLRMSLASGPPPSVFGGSVPPPPPASATSTGPPPAPVMAQAPAAPAIQEETTITTAAAAPGADLAYYVALYAFAGTDPEDLPFEESDILVVTGQGDGSDDWWQGYLYSDPAMRVGAFPRTNVTEYVAEE
jgi:hypothetical protein